MYNKIYNYFIKKLEGFILAQSERFWYTLTHASLKVLLLKILASGCKLYVLISF